MRITGKRPNTVMLGVAALILLAIVGFSFREWRQYTTANADGARSTAVRESADRLLTGLLDAETGQRGFLLTGADRYLEPYDRAVQTVPAELATLKRLLLERPAGSTDLTRLNNLVDRKLAELGQTIDLRRSQGAKQATDIVLNDEGKRTMDEIRVMCFEIKRRENAAQSEASLAQEGAALTALLVTIGGTLLLLFFFAAGLEPVLSLEPRMTKKSRLLVYGAAVAATAAATLLRMALTPLLGPLAVPFIMYFPALGFAAWYGGFRAGALSLLLSALAADYFFLAPTGGFAVSTVGDRISLLIFILTGFGIVLLGDSQRRAVARQGDAERTERDQRRRFETTLTSIGDAVISTDADGHILFANKVAQSLVRWPEADMLGKHLDEVFRIVNEDTRAKVESPVAKVLREGTIVGLANHTILIARDGTEVPIDDSAAPIRGDTGAIEGTVLVFRDITGRKQAEERFRMVVEAAPNAMIMVGGDGHITLVNSETEKLFGYGRAELIGQPVETLVPERYRGGHGALRGSFFQAPSVRAMGTGRDLFGVRKDGSEVPIEIGLNPIRIDQEDFVLAAIIDISERKKAEKALRASNEGLSSANEDLERFAFIASHDLQEPLRMITTYAQLLAKEYAGHGKNDVGVYVGHVVNGTKRMRDLIADLLTYTEIRGKAEEPVEVIDLDLVIENVRQNLQAAIDESGAVITSDRLPAIGAHAAHFVPLFQNLIGNAIKYRSGHPPRIHISVAQPDGQLRFAVADNGIGIEPEYHEGIFMAFKRLHGKKIPGTGIGLAICQRVVERYGGRIWVESELGQGSTFYFTLPDIAVHSAGSTK